MSREATDNGKPAEASWAGYVDLYEKLNGRTPTPAQVKEAWTKRDAAKACGEPFAAVIALDQEAQAGRERLACAIEEATKRLSAGNQAGVLALSPESLAAIEAAVTRAIAPPVEAVPPSRVVAWLRERWPMVAATLTRCQKWVARVIEARWPIALAGAALTLMLLAAISLSASVATRQQDVFLARELSTPAGVAALALARSNPSLADVLRSCPRDPQRGGRTAMTCHLWAIGEGGSVAHPTWMSTALAAISGWSAVWLTGALGASWVVIVVLGWTKRGPATRRRRLM